MRTCADDKYELANFSDDELVEGVRAVARKRRHRDAGSLAWERKFRSELALARSIHGDIKHAAKQMRLGELKVDLAEHLWPVLRERCAAEAASGDVETPALRPVLDVLERVEALDRVTVLARQ
jgi:hypothetical protein